MMKVQSMREAYANICKMVMNDGRETSPRGILTSELPSQTFELLRPDLALATGCGRKLNLAIAAAEAAQLVAGVSCPELMCKITPNFAAFRDGGAFLGAYGPRVRTQIPAVIQRLNDDPDTRQAIINIWDPAYDLHGSGRDTPCTCLLQFMIRQGNLELHVTMRSNDVWWGLPYDVFQFTQLQLSVANALDVGVGSYFHHANSFHAYARDFEKIAVLKTPATGVDRHNDETSLGWSCDHGIVEPTSYWGYVQRAAQDFLEKQHKPETRTELWYGEQLRKFL